MNKPVELQTDRLLLRQWRQEDFPLFAAINADPRVMEYFPQILSTEESDALATRLMNLIDKRSWGCWAVETKAEQAFIGFVGLHEPPYELPVSPCVEVGWRLARQHWGKGYATEAAKAALQFGFDVLNLNEIYSFTSVSNSRSWAVMERLGMRNMGRNFEHPIIPEGHPLREHFLYIMTRDQWKGTAA